jgi:hypothetical protein
MKKKINLKIIFTSGKINAASYDMYKQNLNNINLESYNGDVLLDISNDPQSVQYDTYDVALFMGYDEASKLAKEQKSNILIGIIDPRASFKNNLKYTDFIISNGLESRDYFNQFIEHIFIYHTYYPVKPIEKLSFKNKKKIILGYHGNKIHLDAMFPRVTDAINTLANEYDVELWAMYNIKNFGYWKLPEKKNFLFNVKHIQYSQENYSNYIAHTDIGLVPQFMPLKNNNLLKYMIGSFNKKYNESLNDYFFRFKETTNIGRHLVFAQYGIPIISDMSPSACNFINDGVDGYLAHHSKSWYYCLKSLIKNKEFREKMGKMLREKFDSYASPEVQNKNLIDFLLNLKKNNRKLES